MRTVEQIIKRARRMGRVENGLVLCDNCDTPASKSLSVDMSWTGCAPCMLGEADAFDEADLIAVEGGASA